MLQSKVSSKNLIQKPVARTQNTQDLSERCVIFEPITEIFLTN
jgi:hypothetical protein